MRAPSLSALLLAAALPLQAQDDPLKSAACGAALQRLESARSDRAEAARIEALRAQAAQTCLGAPAPPARPGRVVQPPTSVPPVPLAVPRAEGPAPGPAPAAAPLPPVPIERSPAPASCDGNGCWVDDGGGRLRHVPPSLVGPSGLPCQQQAGVVYCR